MYELASFNFLFQRRKTPAYWDLVKDGAHIRKKNAMFQTVGCYMHRMFGHTRGVHKSSVVRLFVRSLAMHGEFVVGATSQSVS